MIRKTLTSLILGVALVLLFQLSGVVNLFTSTAQAVGDLTVDWGVKDGAPIFELVNLAPGASKTSLVTVTNNASATRRLAVRGFKSTETGTIGDVLQIIIKENETDLYGGSQGIKTLNTFFQEGASTDGILLTSLAHSAQKRLKFQVSLPAQSDNRYQNKSINFTLLLGVSATVPEQCETGRYDGTPIYGTQGADRLNGTKENDLIFAFEGDDQVNGKGGNDCIVGGDGNDTIQGGSGDDMIDGGKGNDLIRGGSGKDSINGYEGNDLIFGQGENDILYGGIGRDLIDSGTGSDLLYGNEEDDHLTAGSGDDQLVGGEGRDTLKGGSGRDHCSGEIKSSCELIL